MKNRLARLEKVARLQSVSSCRLCKGEPWATLYRVEDWSSGERSAPEWFLAEEYADRLTDELRCRRCGMGVPERRLLILFLIKGAGWPLRDDPPGRSYRAISPDILPRPA
jgi:hypothetical protein